MTHSSPTRRSSDRLSRLLSCLEGRAGFRQVHRAVGSRQRQGAESDRSGQVTERTGRARLRRPAGPHRPMRINDTVFGAVLLALAIFIWTQAAGFPKVPGTQYGSGFFPQVIAIGLGVGALLLMWRGRRALAGGERLAEIGRAHV